MQRYRSRGNNELDHSSPPSRGALAWIPRGRGCQVVHFSKLSLNLFMMTPLYAVYQIGGSRQYNHAPVRFSPALSIRLNGVTTLSIHVMFPA